MTTPDNIEEPATIEPDPMATIKALEEASNEAVETNGPDGWDNRTHIERINTFTNPADGTGLGDLGTFPRHHEGT